MVTGKESEPASTQEFGRQIQVTLAECSGWLCFHGKNEDRQPWPDDDLATKERPDDTLGLPPDELADLPAPRPYIALPKLGRNELCPCGSDKKYKKSRGKI